MQTASCFRILLSAAMLTPFAGTIGRAATRARFRAETNLNDASARISAGYNHTCQINEDGTVRCWGDNSRHQLGSGTTASATATPVPVPGLNNVVAIAAGFQHTCALLSDSTVKCWGWNDQGQLGDGTKGTDRPSPVTVIGLNNAVAVTGGTSHTCALLADGTAKCWGENSLGQLGNGTLAEALSPVAVTNLNNGLSVTAGLHHTCVLLANGTAKCWGDNSLGQLGHQTSNLIVSSPIDVVGLTNAAAIVGGDGFTCALLANGTAQCWGRNDFGELGDGTTANRNSPVAVRDVSNAVGITAGAAHACAVQVSGAASCWGDNDEGQLGDGTKKERLTPVGVDISHFLNAVAITSKGVHTCALLVDGSVKCWGNNRSGQLGNGSFSGNSTLPTVVLGGGGSFTARAFAAGRNHTCAVRANATVACWGSNDSGQIGNGTFDNQPSPVTALNVINATAVAAGEAHTCSVSLGLVYCWGSNLNGQLAAGTVGVSSRFPLFTAVSNAIAIAAGGALGSSHSCALLSDGTVKCWGANGSGQLGDGSTTSSAIPVLVKGLTNAVSIAVGELHSCALVSAGATFCWGSNTNGQLGTSPPLATQLTPTLVSLDSVVAIAGGNLHTCALQAFGMAFWCWGGNLLGQLGINSTVSPQPAPRLVVNTANVAAVAIAGGFGHTCAIVADGGARCWGDNASGQLGNGTTNPTTIPAVVQVPGTDRLLNPAKPLSRAVTITTGRRHSCALIATGALSCWGDNTFGQLGINSTVIQQNSPVAVPSFTVNIDPQVILESNRRVTTVTVVAECDAGQQLQVDVSLTQGEVSGRGTGAGQCAGGLAHYPVTVTAEGTDPFVAGPARVKAEALIRDIGLAVETQEWTREVNIATIPR